MAAVMEDFVNLIGKWMSAAAENPSARMHGMSDRFLARAIVKMCRSARELHGPFLRKEPESLPSYPAVLAWDVGPEISARLGEREFLLLERSCGVRSASASDLRAMAWVALTRSPGARAMDKGVGVADPWNLMRKNVGDGNPLFIALDRLSPPEGFDVRKDPAAARVVQTCVARGIEPRLCWHPEMQNPPGAVAPRRIFGSWAAVVD